MMRLRSLFSRIRGLWHAEEIHREIAEEVRFHIDMRTEENILRGMSPDEARHEAERRFGNLTQIKERGYEVRGGRWLETSWQDLRFGSRMLRKHPGFTVAAVFTLALGIGANTAIFSVVNAVLMRPLPYPNPEQLIAIQDSLPGIGFPKAGLTEAEFLRLRDETQTFERVTVYVYETFTLTGAGEPERISSGLVSSDFFPLLGVEMEIGRGFRREEESEGQNDVVILSHGFWQRKFASNPDVLGQALTLNGRSYTIIGVLAPDFKSPLELQADTRVELWVPFGIDLSRPRNGNHGLNAIGRLRPGATIEQAQAEASTIIGQVVKDQPSFYPADGSFRVVLTPFHKELVGDVRLALLVLLGAVVFVLAIACANVANLLLARSEARHKEIAIRMALGASRARIIRQLLVESTLLSMIGGILGLLLASWGLGLIVAFSPENIPRLQEVSLDRRVLCFTFLISLFTGIVFGLAPALQAIKSDLQSSLKEGGRTSGLETGRRRLRDVLVVTELALSVLLLVGAGLLIRSFWSLQRVDAGFNREHLLTLRAFPPASTYPDNQQVAAFYERLLTSIQSLPGVKSAAATSSLPISGNNFDTIMDIEGRPFDVSLLHLSTDFRVVSPDYFKTIEVRLARGRLFTDADQEGTMRAALINETLARTHWPNEDPLGRRIRLMDGPPERATTPFMTIVGIVADAKNRSLSDEPRQEVYVPLSQHAASLGKMGVVRRMTLVVRTTTDPMSLANVVRQEVWTIDRSIPITDVQTMEQVLDMAIVQPRFNMILLGLFAAIALGLGAIGIYGVMSYSVAQRTHEFGIRMALGARSLDVLKLVLKRGVWLTSLGTGLGVAASFALTRVMKSLLYGVSAADPLTIAGVALLLMAVALLACYLPARRATKVDPLVALRYE